MRSLAQLESSTLELGDSGRRCLGPQIRLRSHFISLEIPYLEGKEQLLTARQHYTLVRRGFRSPSCRSSHFT